MVSSRIFETARVYFYVGHSDEDSGQVIGGLVDKAYGQKRDFFRFQTTTCKHDENCSQKPWMDHCGNMWMNEKWSKRTGAARESAYSWNLPRHSAHGFWFVFKLSSVNHMRILITSQWSAFCSRTALFDLCAAFKCESHANPHNHRHSAYGFWFVFSL